MINDRLLDCSWSTRHIMPLLAMMSLLVTACPKEKRSTSQNTPNALPSIVPKGEQTPPKHDNPPKTVDTSTPKTKPASPAGTQVLGGLKVATWNIEWLHRDDGKGNTPRTKPDYETLKRYADRLNADVIALQEVDGPEAARRLFDPKIYDFHFEDRNSVQRVGIVYKKSLKVTRHPDVKAFQLGRHRRLRHGVDMTVHSPSGQRLRVLAVHLKSGCWSSPFDGPVRGGERPEACKIIKAQNDVLKQWIDSQRRKNASFVILGDFNRRLKPREPFWLKLQKSDRRADLVSPTLTKRSKCLGGRYPDYIDHIIVGGPATKGFSLSTFKQVLFDRADARRHPRRLSDHCPIRATLNRR